MDLAATEVTIIVLVNIVLVNLFVNGLLQMKAVEEIDLALEEGSPE